MGFDWNELFQTGADVVNSIWGGAATPVVISGGSGTIWPYQTTQQQQGGVEWGDVLMIGGIVVGGVLIANAFMNRSRRRR